jgi:hypothetical protein
MQSVDGKEYCVTLFLRGENGMRPFLNHAFNAPDDADAKNIALKGMNENKPSLYEAVEIRLRCGDSEIWSSPINDRNIPLS